MISDSSWSYHEHAEAKGGLSRLDAALNMLLPAGRYADCKLITPSLDDVNVFIIIILAKLEFTLSMLNFCTFPTFDLGARRLRGCRLWDVWVAGKYRAATFSVLEVLSKMPVRMALHLLRAITSNLASRTS